MDGLLSMGPTPSIFLPNDFIYLVNSHGGPQSFDFEITYFISNYRDPQPMVVILG